MPFKRKKILGGLKQQRRIDALRRAVRDATANRQARQAVGAQSAPVGVQGVEIPEVQMSGMDCKDSEILIKIREVIKTIR